MENSKDVDVLTAANGKSDQYSSSPSIEYSEQENNIFRLQPRTASNLIQSTSKIEWLVEGILPLGRCLMISAASGVGKSWLSLDLALAVDLGDPWLGHFLCRKGEVLVVDEENGDVLLKERLIKLLNGRGLQHTDCNIKFITMSGFNLSNRSHTVEMSRLLDHERPHLVIFDTLVRIHNGDESSAKDMAPISRLFKEWSVKYECAFCINHHDRKPGAGGHSAQFAFRGSSEIQAFVDSHLDLRAKEPGLLSAIHAKARFAKSVDPFGIEIVDENEESVQIRFTDQPHSKKMTKVDEAKGYLLSFLTAEKWTPRKDILGAGKKEGHAKNTLDSALCELFEGEKLERKTIGNTKLFRLNSFSSSHNPIGEKKNKIQ